MNWERKISQNPFCHFTYQRMQNNALFCLYTFNNFPTVFKEVGEELDDTYHDGDYFHSYCSLAVSLNFGGIKKIHHLIRSQGNQKRQMGVYVIFISEETNFFFKLLKSIHSFGAFLPSY